jgi:MFS family permease
MTLLIILVAPQAGRLADRFGPRWLVGAGLALVASSLVLYTRLEVDSTFWTLLPALLTGGVGMALAMTPTTAAAMGAVSVDKAGVGSAVLNSMRQVGGSLGIAIMGAVVVHVSAGAAASGASRPEAYVDGFHRALELAAVFALTGAVVAVATLRKIEHPREQQREQPHPAAERA